MWQDSFDCVLPTVKKLKELGVSRLRLLPVEPSFRWSLILVLKEI